MAVHSVPGTQIRSGPSTRPDRPYGNIGNTERALSFLGGAALATYGLSRRSAAGLGMATLGGALAGRALTGRSRLYGALGVTTTGGRVHADHAAVDPAEAVAVERTVTIARSPRELYAAWRDLPRLPRYMDPLERVDVHSSTRSHWVARGPGGIRVEWDATIVEAREGERIVWETIEPTDIPHRGEVSFRDAPGDRGTEVALTLVYEPPVGGFGRAVAGALDHPPGGRAGRAVAELLGASPAAQVATALRRFKQVAEAGEVPTTEGQPSGRAVIRPSEITSAGRTVVPPSEKMSSGRTSKRRAK